VQFERLTIGKHGFILKDLPTSWSRRGCSWKRPPCAGRSCSAFRCVLSWVAKLLAGMERENSRIRCPHSVDNNAAGTPSKFSCPLLSLFAPAFWGPSCRGSCAFEEGASRTGWLIQGFNGAGSRFPRIFLPVHPGATLRSSESWKSPGGGGSGLRHPCSRKIISQNVPRSQGAEHQVRALRLPEHLHIPIQNNGRWEMRIIPCCASVPLLVLEEGDVRKFGGGALAIASLSRKECPIEELFNPFILTQRGLVPRASESSSGSARS